MKKIFFTVAILIITSFVYSQNIDSGLVASYPFNGNANDVSGNNNHGTVYGATLTTDRYNLPNKAYYFNGTISYIKVPNSTSLGLYGNLNSSITLCTWINTPVIVKQVIFGRWGGTTGIRYVMFMEDGGFGDMHLTVHGIFGNEAMANNTWYFLTGVYDHMTNIIKFYINGILDSSKTITAPFSGSDTPCDLDIGRYNDGSYYFSGKIDDIRIYNRALSQTEINQLVTSVKNLNTEIPLEYNLSQNYPNPFNPTTNIKFNILKSEFVTLKIFDMPGREIATLLNERLNVGTYQVEWNAGTYPSGSYFYRLQTNDFTDTKRMILLK